MILRLTKHLLKVVSWDLQNVLNLTLQHVVSRVIREFVPGGEVNVLMLTGLLQSLLVLFCCILSEADLHATAGLCSLHDTFSEEWVACSYRK